MGRKILFVTTDQQRYDAIGCNGGTVARTPVIDALAAQGHRWDDFEDVLFYSDSTNDLPLLGRVDHPVATNPDDRLREQAHQRGWPILELFSVS